MKRINNAQGEQLIELIKERPYLYDKTDENYKQSKIRKAAWKDISDKIGLSQHDCKTTWKSLRDQFVKAQKGKFNERQGECSPSKTYKYYDKLLFLNKCFESEARLKRCSESSEASVPIPEEHLEIQIKSPPPKRIKQEIPPTPMAVPTPNEVATDVTSSSHELIPAINEPPAPPMQKPYVTSVSTPYSHVETNQFFLSLSAMVKNANLTASQVRQVQRTLINALVDKLDSFENV